MSLPWSYTSRLGRDVDRWHAAGYIDDDGRGRDPGRRRRAALASSACRRHSAILGATLIGFSAMTFVAANWQEMSKLARLLLLGVRHVVVPMARRRCCSAGSMAIFGHAAVLAGTAIFGAAIMLVAQMYHMEGNPPDAVLMWALGALRGRRGIPLGPGAGARHAADRAVERLGNATHTGVHWPFLLGWLAVAAADSCGCAGGPACICRQSCSPAGS